MKVLLSITNVNGFHEIPFSFGLNSIASYAASRGHLVKILAVRNENEFILFDRTLHDFNPDVVGFTAVSSQFGCVKQLAKRVKDLKENIMVVCGGIHATLFPQAIEESESIDAMFVGESEIAFGEFLDALQENRDYHGISNLAYRKDDQVVINQLNPLITNLESLPFPVLDDLFADYINHNGWAPFFFSRGCPFVCTYCCNDAYAKLYGMARNRPRYRSAESCIEEIKIAEEKYEFEKIWIVDNIFGVDPKWRNSFCNLYKKEIRKPFFCNLQVNVINEEYVRDVKDAGCFRVSMSIESGNEYIRNTIMKRNMSAENILAAYRLCKKFGLETQSINIIGLPHETEEMIWDTINLNRQVNPTLSGVNIFYPYKGTYLGDYCFKNNMVDETMYNEFSMERRDSVLLFPQNYKNRLCYYQQNWEKLVYPNDYRRRIVSLIKKNKALYNGLKSIRDHASKIRGK